MNITIYSTNSNHYDGRVFHYTNLPSNAKNLEGALKAFFGDDCLEKHKFTIVSQLPGMFLLDLAANELSEKSPFIDYKILSSSDESSPEKIADLILETKPDLAFAATYWVTPLDWLGLNDSIIARLLEKKGVRVICNSLECQLMSFDKIQTHSFLKSRGFSVAKAVYVHHELFWAERKSPEVRDNPYKESVFFRIKDMNFPLIIKDTSGLSSFGMEVCKTFGQVKNFLCSKKNNGDKIVEEFIEGPQFAMEIWGNEKDGYKVFKPFMVSVNQYGITSPKQSVKIGPVKEGLFPLESLNSQLLRLAKETKACGILQVDFAWDEKNSRWVIFELNPRLSGMTQLQYESWKRNSCPAMSLKFPILDSKTLEKLSQVPFVRHVTQTVNDEAKQQREHGYCEAVLTGESFEELKENLTRLEKDFSSCMEESFFNTAMKLFKAYF